MQLPEFKDMNAPVLISSTGAIYVGDKRSLDNGKTFSPYFQWTQLAEAVQSQLKGPPHVLRITAIESLTPTILKITLDTGIRNISLAGRVQSGQIQFWQAY